MNAKHINNNDYSIDQKHFSVFMTNSSVSNASMQFVQKNKIILHKKDTYNIQQDRDGITASQDRHSPLPRQRDMAHSRWQPLGLSPRHKWSTVLQRLRNDCTVKSQFCESWIWDTLLWLSALYEFWVRFFSPFWDGLCQYVDADTLAPIRRQGICNHQTDSTCHQHHGWETFTLSNTRSRVLVNVIVSYHLLGQFAEETQQPLP